jgi:hypothetical protein
VVRAPLTGGRARHDGQVCRGCTTSAGARREIGGRLVRRAADASAGSTARPVARPSAVRAEAFPGGRGRLNFLSAGGLRSATEGPLFSCSQRLPVCEPAPRRERPGAVLLKGSSHGRWCRA